MNLNLSKQFLFISAWLLALLLVSCTANGANSVVFLGSFSKERVTQEHQYIYQLDLWREGKNLFGFYSFNAGLYGDGITKGSAWRIEGEIKGALVTLKNEKLLFSFNGQLTKQKLSGRWKNSNEVDLVLIKQPLNQIEPAMLDAPLISSEVWGLWAERHIDSVDANDKQLLEQITSCTNGNGMDCMAVGNHSKLRKNLAKAEKYYEVGCNFNEAYACIAVGRAIRAKEIWKNLCTGKSSMENNFACRALGELAEKDGELSEAKEWFRKGCNSSIPLVCQDFKRLNQRK
ncbi:MAG: hypothetical protein PXX73_05150 [Sideroxydans sp.]|nr:hypothetical protein [Sideroxydans sp.]